MTSSPAPLPATGPAALATEHLDLRISGVHIVSDVTISIAQGELVGIIGPNGAGKTSLLNLLSGTLPVSGGTIHMFGRDITKLRAFRRAKLGLGRTFQTSYLLLGLTVLENVRLMVQADTVRGMQLLRMVTSKDPTYDRAREALDRVGLADKATVLAGALSHGDRRKLELAIVLSSDTRLVLLDEPMAGVHADDVDGLTELIREVHRTAGVTVLMVEHRMPVVLGLADRIAVMHHGSMLAFGSPDEVMADQQVQTAYIGQPL